MPAVMDDDSFLATRVETAEVRVPRRWPTVARKRPTPKYAKLRAELGTLARTIVSSYSDVLFLSGPKIGFLVMLATMWNLRAGTAGLASALSSYLFAAAIGLRHVYHAAGYYSYNAILIGISLGAMLDWSVASLVFVLSAGAASFMATAAIAGAWRTYFRMPPMSLPFVLVMIVTQLSMLHYSNLLYSADVAPSWLAESFGLPASLAQFLRAMGTIMFSPSVPAGLMFTLLIVSQSRILFLLGVGGYCLGGMVRALWLGSAAQAFGDPSNVNAILVAMAVGGAFMTPSLASYVMAAAAVVAVVATLDAVQLVFAPYAIPAYNLPFNLTCLCFVYAAAQAGSPSLPTFAGKTPEETLEIALSTRWRFPEHRRSLQLPFFGAWTVWQRFDDEWTHQGDWRYAYDFVLADEEGRTFQDAGASVDDYFCFRKPVLAPVSGRVVRIVNELPDNEIGRADSANNWGNLVVLYDPRGFHVELSHFAQGSIRVKPGEWVEAGTQLGLCGNSGYSPQPHLHVQAQWSDQVGAPTIPFCFAAYRDDDELFAYGLPEKDAVVESTSVDVALDRSIDFLLGDRMSFDVWQKDRRTGRLDLVVKMAADGVLYFESGDGSRLYFGKHDRSLFLYRVEGSNAALRAIFRTMPRLPLTGNRQWIWKDELPATILCTGWKQVVAQLAAAIAPRWAAAEVKLYFEDRSTAVSEASWKHLGVRRRGRVILDDAVGIVGFECGEILLRRTQHVADAIRNRPLFV